MISKSQKVVKVGLVDIGFSFVQELNHGHQLTIIDPPHENEGVRVFMLLENLPEERTGRGQNKFVSLHLFPNTADQRHICKVLFCSEISERITDDLWELVPLQAKFF